MKKFDNARMVLFDSTNAAFRLAVETQTVRTTPQGVNDLVYVTNKGTAILNPNIYLTFAYKMSDGLPATVYTSYPQLFRIREALETVKAMVVDKSGFVEADGMISVKPGCDTPVVIDNIGKAGNWISFKLVIMQSGENGVMTTLPAVSLELSTSNGYASVLTVEEFLTIYTIIKDLDLATIQATVSMGFLSADRAPQQGQYQAPQGMPGGYYPQQPQPYYQPQAPYGGGQRPQTPRYGNGGYRNGGNRQVPPAPNAAPQAPHVAPAPQQPQQQSKLPPREANKPIMSLNAVSETPVDTVSFDDTSAIDEIFDE